MNKKIIIIVILIGILGLLIVISNVLTKNKTASQTDDGIPGFTIPKTNQIPKMTNPFIVLSTTPHDTEQNVSLSPTITIIFNKAITNKDVLFSILPAINFSSQIDKTNLIIKPTSTLKPGTQYTYIIKFPLVDSMTTTYSFTTTGPTQEFLPDTRPEALDQEDQAEKNAHPDVFLTNSTPYANEHFSITSQFVQQPTGHFAFTVQIKDSDVASGKNALMTWMQSLGLTTSQIQSLDIQYR